MKTFKIMLSSKYGEKLSIPFELISQYEERAYKNHSQTLTRLNERGGLSPQELYLVINDLPLRAWNNRTEAEALEWIIEFVESRIRT